LQVREIRAYCDRAGIVLIQTVTACGRSGSRPFDERGGQTVKEVVLRDEVDTLVVTDAARISRNMEDVVEIAGWLDEQDVRIDLIGDGSCFFPGS